MAAALELRGYASAGRPPRYATAWSRHDVRVAACAAAIALTAVVTRVAGAGAFDAYPSLEVGGEPGRRGGDRAAAAVRARAVRRRPRAPGGGACLSPCFAPRAFGYRYPGAAQDALADLTLALEPGSFTLVVGESGSGKSTLLRAACGLVPHFHGGDARGELEVAGMSVRDHGPNDLAASCATLLQDPETQVVMNGVRAELALPLEQRGYEAAAIARAVEEAALELGVAHLLERRTDTLSGGELQRVALAAAVAGKPSLLVLDEPTSQLDPVAGDDLVWLLRRLNEEWGTAVLLAEHRLERCLAAADRVLVMDGGRVVLDARARRVPRLGHRARVGARHAGRAALLARRASARRRSR